jgi:phosphoribosylformylglycinamidine synthase
MRAPGTNCDRETALALELVGARPEAVHIERLLSGGARLDDFALLVLPGGFSYGDQLGAGTLWAHRLQALAESLARFVASGRPVLGICNGFQALLELELLQGGALAPNASGRFECRWVWLRRPERALTPLLDGIERIARPVAHGEGRFVPRDEATLTAMQRGGEVALVYCAEDGGQADYPANPNGSEGGLAALSNAAGNVLGLMPHPERVVFPGQAPAGRRDGDGLAIFANAVRMARG